MDADIQNDENRPYNNMNNLRTNFLNDEDEDEDDDNIAFAGWCSKNNIKCLQENMDIVNDALDDMDFQDLYFNF
jgi:hypothetical protein